VNAEKERDNSEDKEIAGTLWGRKIKQLQRCLQDRRFNRQPWATSFAIQDRGGEELEKKKTCFSKRLRGVKKKKAQSVRRALRKEDGNPKVDEEREKLQKRGGKGHLIR